MAELGKIELPVQLVMTENSKDLIRELVSEALKDTAISFSADTLRTFIRAEVRKVLTEEFQRMCMTRKPLA